MSTRPILSYNHTLNLLREDTSSTAKRLKDKKHDLKKSIEWFGNMRGIDGIKFSSQFLNNLELTCCNREPSQLCADIDGLMGDISRGERNFETWDKILAFQVKKMEAAL